MHFTLQNFFQPSKQFFSWAIVAEVSSDQFVYYQRRRCQNNRFVFTKSGGQPHEHLLLIKTRKCRSSTIIPYLFKWQLLCLITQLDVLTFHCYTFLIRLSKRISLYFVLTFAWNERWNEWFISPHGKLKLRNGNWNWNCNWNCGHAKYFEPVLLAWTLLIFNAVFPTRTAA